MRKIAYCRLCYLPMNNDRIYIEHYQCVSGNPLHGDYDYDMVGFILYLKDYMFEEYPSWVDKNGIWYVRGRDNCV